MSKTQLTALLFVLAIICFANVITIHAQDNQSEDITAEVINIDLHAMVMDGPGLLVVRSNAGETIKIEISSCEGPCVLEASELLQSLQIGEKVMFRGDMKSNKVRIFDVNHHYLKRVTKVKINEQESKGVLS